MQEIHLIQTDKQTGLFYTNAGLQFSIIDKVRYKAGEEGFHIYITSNKKPKKGDWIVDTGRRKVSKVSSYDSKLEWFVVEDGSYASGKKIIKTTDKDLISNEIAPIKEDWIKNYLTTKNK
jgi:hypothetical protein